MSTTIGSISSRTSCGRVIAAVLLAALTLAAYWPATGNGWIWDDDSYVQENPHLRSLRGLAEIWLRPGAVPQYYPLVHTSYWLEYRLWGTEPGGYHAVNILLHAASAVLVWRLLRRLEVPGAWAAAAIFALHPVQVESVAWVTERKNVLSGLFYLASAAAFLRWAPPERERGAGGSPRLYAASLALFVCALLSKTVTCSLPAALLLVAWWKRGRIERADVRPLVPFFIAGLALGALTVWLEKANVGAAGPDWELSFAQRVLIAGRALWTYAGKLAWPAPLVFFYPRFDVDPAQWRPWLYPAAAAAVVSALWLLRRRLGRGPLVAVLFFAGTLVPALGFFDVYPMRFSFVADHFPYLASIGLITLTAACGAAAAGRIGPAARMPAAAVLAAVLGALGTLTWQRCLAFRDAETLWRDTLEKNPDAWLAHNNLGVILRGRGKDEEAVAHYRRSIELKPDYGEAHSNLGGALASLGRNDEAIEHIELALRLNPDNASAHVNMGGVLRAQGRTVEAIEHYRRAIELNPRLPRAHLNLAITLEVTGDLDGAARHYRQALELQPEGVMADEIRRRLDGLRRGAPEP